MKNAGLDNIDQAKDLMKYTGLSSKDLAKRLENSSIESILGIDKKNLDYLMKKTNMSEADILAELNKRNITIDKINGLNADEIVKNLDKKTGYCNNRKYSLLGNMTFEDGKRYSSWSKLREEGLLLKQVDKIKTIPKGRKPLPETYLSEEYINNHLNSFKKSGAVKIMPSEPLGTIGGKGGTFVMSGEELNEIIKNANGDVSKIESVLGLDKGYLGTNPVIVTIQDTSSLRIPSGNELGAWPEYWEPGGYTSGGIKEAVIDPVVEGTYTYKYLFE